MCNIMNTVDKIEKERKRIKRPYYKLNLEIVFIPIMKSFRKGIHNDISPWEGISFHDAGRTGAVIRFMIAHYIVNAMLNDKKTYLFSKEERDYAKDYLDKLSDMKNRAKEDFV